MKMALGWLVPLLLGIAVTGLFLRIRTKTLGVPFGIISIVACYLYLVWQDQCSVAECIKTGSMCGEWSLLLDGLYSVMCLVNVIALAGIFSIVNRLQAARSANILQSNSQDAATDLGISE
jgi:hypothetical protein